MYNLFDLYVQIETRCPKTRTCVDCQFEFPSVEQFHLHLKYSCESVNIQCGICDQVMPRNIFRLHKCYLEKGQGLLDLLQKSDLAEQ